MDEDSRAALPLGISPDRVILHIDLDAFYAQVEIERLHRDPSKPLCVQQWSSLIAVNYPARAQGVSRFMTVVEAKKVCPELECVHTEILDKAGNPIPFDSNLRQKGDSKVSLHRYRSASMRIFAVLLRVCGEKYLEKASVDEAFVDASVLVDRYLSSGSLPKFSAGFAPPAAAATTEEVVEEEEILPGAHSLNYSSKAIEHVVSSNHVYVVPFVDGKDARGGPKELSQSRGLLSVTSSSDVRLAAGAVIADRIRQIIKLEVGYECSCGIAHNKMFAKLGSGRNKPNAQTVLPSFSVGALLNRLKLTKIRYLGGKKGKIVTALILAARGKDPAPNLGSIAIGTDEKDEGEVDNDDDDNDEEGGDNDDDDIDNYKDGDDNDDDNSKADPEKEKKDETAVLTAGDAQILKLNHLQQYLGDEAGLWVYRIVRGIDLSEIVARGIKPKSMLCAKNVSQAPAFTKEDAESWLRMLSTELSRRIMDDHAIFNRHPKSLNIFLRCRRSKSNLSPFQGSKTVPMPPQKVTPEKILMTAMTTLSRISNLTYPITYFSLCATQFEDVGAGGQDISSFFLSSSLSSSNASRHKVDDDDDDDELGPAMKLEPRRNGIEAAFERQPKRKIQDFNEVIVIPDDDDEVDEVTIPVEVSDVGKSRCPLCGCIIRLPPAEKPDSVRAIRATNEHVDECLKKMKRKK